jgi:competence protein ComEA
MAIKSYKYFIKEYFTFTKKEKKPILLLVGIIVIILLSLAWLKFMPNNSKTDFTTFEKEITAFEKRLSQDSLVYAETKNKKIFNKVQPVIKQPLTEISLFEFNPNNLADSLWLKLGINEHIIKTIKKFEAKGGKFYKKDDLKKIYSFNDSDYKRLEPYIIIPEKKYADKKDTSFIKAEKFPVKIIPTIIFDLNNASIEDLVTLRGIGNAKANSIVKYRSLLGGYFEKKQLMEAYGIDSALYDSIKTQLDIKTRNLKTININTAFEPGLKHPYISKQLAVIIVNYRKMHGNYKSVEEIKKLALINDELYRKLAPYLTVE